MCQTRLLNKVVERGDIPCMDRICPRWFPLLIEPREEQPSGSNVAARQSSRANLKCALHAASRESAEDSDTIRIRDDVANCNGSWAFKREHPSNLSGTVHFSDEGVPLSAFGKCLRSEGKLVVIVTRNVEDSPTSCRDARDPLVAGVRSSRNSDD